MDIKNYLQKFQESYTKETLSEEIESEGLLKAYSDSLEVFVPAIDYSDPKNFCYFGSAEYYYNDSIQRVISTYPYDGSLKEKQEWHNSSSYLDRWMLENRYPFSTGYINFSANGWSTLVGSKISGYGQPTNLEYIQFKGGPNTGSLGFENYSFTKAFEYSNIFDTENNRSSNLELEPTGGVTVEFWLKKSSFNNSNTEKEVIFDLWNNSLSSSNSYGRLTIELSGNTSGSPFIVTLQSGTSGFYQQQIGSGITTSSLTNWHHYAISFANNSSSGIDVRFYQDGVLNQTSNYGSSINEITGALIANIGALRTAPSGTFDVSQGWGKLSASLDEFRYWKTKRTSKEIGRNWWSTIGGGTNTDDANTDLGVYYTFNEGITGTSSVDSRVLDYSGRVTNGFWTGYTTNSRNTGSAINEYSGSFTEEGSPIVYSNHPSVVSLLSEFTQTGSYHDYQNNVSIYNSIPSWILEEDESTGFDLKKLIQIIASYFDKLYLQIQFMNNLKNIHTNISGNLKPPFFSNQILESHGFNAPDMFIDSLVIENILSKNESFEYTDNLYDIKNTIYQNIYSNLLNIYKAKGSEKSFRNLLHCFGIDEKIIKINLYSNNSTFTFNNNENNLATKTKLLDFANQDRYAATVYQYSSSVNANSYSYITGSSNLSFVPVTLEVQALFPKKLFELETYYSTGFVTASLFGLHSAVQDPSDLSWNTVDNGNMQVYSVRQTVESKNAYFKLSSSYPFEIPELTSSIYNDVYNNERWHFAIRIQQDKDLHSNYRVGSVTTSSTSTSEDVPYTLEFIGLNIDGGIIKQQFSLSSSLSATIAKQFLNSSKRFYVGAERTNYTGSVITYADSKIVTARYWLDYLNDETLTRHAKDVDNYGVSNPYKSAYLNKTSLRDYNISQIDTLVFNWDFNNVTSSDAGGGNPLVNDASFIVEDASSGSSDLYSKYPTWFATIVEKQYLGKGFYYLPNKQDVVDTDYIVNATLKLPEVINSSDMINLLTEDDEVFTSDTRPERFTLLFEKSMYQTISEEMVKMFSSVIDFNNLVGDPINKYRQTYKELNKLKQIFFEKIGNEPDLDKYLDFYKWIDSSMGVMLQQLTPTSAASKNLLTVVESHILERNKYDHKFPTLEFKINPIEAGAVSINKHLYNWRVGHRPVSNLENENCFYWNERAERNVEPISSSLEGVNNSRSFILSASLQVLNRSFTTPHKFSTNINKIIQGGTNFNNNKNLDFSSTALHPHGPLDNDGVLNLPINYLFVGIENTSSLLQDCTDELQPNKKIKYNFTTIHGRDYSTSSLGYSEVLNSKIGLPANFVSGNINTGYQAQVSQEFMSGVIITNIHNDTYGPSNETPIQGPFTNAWVGGRQSRHIDINQGSDTYLTRPEAWKLLLGTGSLPGDYETALGFVGADYPHPEGNPDEPSYPVRAHKRATYLREETAKRPLNIKNIQSSTGSAVLGNYNNLYEVLHTFGATSNNRALINATNPTINTELLSILRTAIVDGRVNFELPTRPTDKSVIITRFSSPGERRTISRGYLNRYAEEMSPYNALPYKNREIIGDGKRNRDAFTHDKFGTPNILSGSKKNLNDLTSLYSEFGGYQSGSAGTVPSFHKINRNALKTIEYSGTTTTTDFDYDNGFFSHQVPQKDSGYSWIKYSISGTSGDFGHVLSDTTLPTGTTAYIPELTFISQSEIGSAKITVLGVTKRHAGVPTGSAGTQFIPVDYLGLNSVVYDSASSYYELGSTSLTETTGGLIELITTARIPNYFNSLISNRNGPYGYTSFKQVRNSYHKLVRKQIKNNKFTILKPSRLVLSRPIRIINVDNINVYNDSPVISSCKPLKTRVKDLTRDVILFLTHSFENNTVYFSNDNINNNLELVNTNIQVYDRLLALASLPENLRKYNIISMSYETTIFPRQDQTYFNNSRRRTSYSPSYWRSDENETTLEHGDGRRRTVSSNLFDYTITKQSIWPLDANANYLSTFSDSGSSINAEGVLQNNYSLITTSSYQTKITSSVLYSYKHTLPSKRSSVSLTGYGSLPTGSFRTFNSPIFKNTTRWEAGIQSGKEPFPVATLDDARNNYQDRGSIDYDNWAEGSAYLTKDFGILPEYRISDNIRFPIEYQSPTSYFEQNNFNVLDLFNFSGTLDSSDYVLQAKDLTNLLKINSDLTQLNDNYEAQINIKCDALLKLLPLESFYPVQRTLDLASQFSSSYFKYVNTVSRTGGSFFPTINNVADAQGMRTFITPFFAPGIMFNTIKSGIAVDYPVITGTLQVTNTYFDSQAIGQGYNYQINNNRFNYRVPFEAIYDPSKIGSIVFTDNNPHPDIRTDVTCSWNGSQTNYFYTAMANNFFAEVPNFFLKESKLSSLVSKPIERILIQDWHVGKKYKALVKLYKTVEASNGSSYGPFNTTPQNNDAIYPKPQKNNDETITMYSQPNAFGPPCAGGYSGSSTYTDGVVDSSNGYNAPFTPPYYDGEAWAILTFNATQTGLYTLSEFLTKLDVKYLRYEFNPNDAVDESSFGVRFYENPVVSTTTEDGPQGWGNINENAMQISSSVDLFNVLTSPEIQNTNPNAGFFGTAGAGGSRTEVTPSGEIWSIQTKFETPILNFNPNYTNLTASKSDAAMSSSLGLAATGMWHQYGLIPSGSEGIYLEICDVPQDYIIYGRENAFGYATGDTLNDPALTGSLLSLMGNPFDVTKVKLGQLNDSKKIEEAVMILFVDKTTGKLLPMPRLRDTLPPNNPNEDQNASFYSEFNNQQLEKLKKYSLPPQIDFNRNSEAYAFAFYLLEFSYTLNSKDLADIWQNLAPDIAYIDNGKWNVVTEEISHTIKPGEVISDVSNLENIALVPVKLKKKAIKTIETIKQRTLSNTNDEFYENRFLDRLPIFGSYNWPYDYFSLIEKAKININVTFSSGSNN